MKNVQFGDWKIQVDLEKTKEYYKNYVIKDTKANKNFAKYCEKMSDEEKSFFESLGITPQCCDIEHVGVANKKIPCGGYYFIYGRYLEYPKYEAITVEELIANDFVDFRKDPRINIGVFQFKFQYKDDIFNETPEHIPEGFICVTFWCEEMPWLLKEKPKGGMKAFEMPKSWQLLKKLKWKISSKKALKQYLKEEKQKFTDTFEKLGISYSEFSKEEYELYKRKWVDAFCPEGANKAEIEECCLPNGKYNTYLWHIFSWEYLDAQEDDAFYLFDSENKNECVLINNLNAMGFKLNNAEKLTAEILNSFVDITVTAPDFSWTYCKTHENTCGPYYYKK